MSTFLSATDILDHLQALETRHNERDSRWDTVRRAREGNLQDLAEDLFTDSLPKPIVANFIDTVARDLAEMIAPLPSFQCGSASMQSDAARRFADRRTKIAANYILQSKLERQMLMGADQLNTYGAVAFYIEPDFEDKLPRICVEDVIGGYATTDRWNCITSYTKKFLADPKQLAEWFPAFENMIFEAAKANMPSGGGHAEVIRYCDKDQITLVLKHKNPVILVSAPNPLKETPVVLAMRPWLHNQYRGQFDDTVWIQVVRDILARLNLEAVTKSVQAPLAVPNDMQEVPLGPDSIIRTGSPEKVRRVGLELPQGAFAESQVLMDELRTGTRYPAARTGGIDASIITGRGVQALLGGFDSQIKSAQMTLRDALVDVIRLCFKMDEKYWPNTAKDIRGQMNGSPYDVTYIPSKHIAGDHSVSVEYGFAAGMDPNRAIVAMLQLRAEKVFSKDYMARQLPFTFDVGEEASKVDVEESREAMKQSLYALAQSIPALAAQGQDPGEIVNKLAEVIKGLQKGTPIEEVAAQVFAPPPPPPGQGGMGPDMAAGGPGGPPGPGVPGGGGLGSGLPPGVAPGQAGTAPGGRPDLQMMLAGLTGAGNPVMSASVLRRRRA